MPTAQHTLETWLERHELTRVLLGLKALAAQHADEELKNSTLIQASRHQSLLDQRHQDLISQADDQQEAAKIRAALLYLVTNLPAEWDDAPLTGIPITKQKNQKPEKKRVQWAQLAAIVAAAIAVLAGIAEFTGYSLRDLLAPPATEHSSSSQPVDSFSHPPDTIRSAENSPKNATVTQLEPRTKPAPVQPEPVPARPIPSSSDTTLRLQTKTDRGRNDLRYAAGENWRLYVQASQPCHLRVIYRLADDRLVLLVDDQTLLASETNQWIDLTGEYEVSAPYGSEAFYVFAQTQPFGPLQTVWEPDGYTRVTEGLPSALRKIRGFKKQHRYAEDSLQLLTYDSL